MKIFPFGRKKAKESEGAQEPEDTEEPAASEPQEAPPPKKEEKPAPLPPPADHKTQFRFLLGLMMIIASFTGVVVIFYFMYNASEIKKQEIVQLSEQVKSLDDEKKIAEMELEHFKTKEGEIELETLLTKAKKYHDPQEQTRSQGLLWIDQEKNNYVVTLGALNGLKVGSELQLYDGERKLGMVTVKTPLDVISHVDVPKNLKRELDKGPYKVTIE